MNLITLNNITKQYGERVLLDQVDLMINAGERVGLLGRNGSGKSTLLRLIAGMEGADEGDRTVWGNVRIRFLTQNPYLDREQTIIEAVFESDAPLMALVRRYESALIALQAAPADETIQTELATLSDEMDRLGGWEAETEAKMILTRLGITDFQKKIGTLSGGQLRRVAMAQVLIDPGNLLILDEPTNHIDADTVAWLEGYLPKLPAAIMMVTHDRYFLENVVTRIVELDRRELISYPGNYRAYLEQRAERERVLLVKEERRQTQLKRELAWLQRGVQARGTKQKGRKQRIEEMRSDRYESGDDRVAMTLAGRRLGKRVLEAENLSKGYDDQILFKALDLQLDPGDRIGIVGPNGAGKSTLLNVLAGKVTPDTGTLDWGTTVALGYFDQMNAGMLGREKMMLGEYLEDIAPLIQTADGERVTAPQMLEWFLFPRNEQRTQIGSLSGGEKRRLYLLSILALQPNVLFLDEPTNDLDVQTLTVLETFLDHFSGTLLVVSHDRFFLDRNVDFIIPFAAGIMGTRYPSPYRPDAGEPVAGESVVSQSVTEESVKPERQKDRVRKLTYKEQKEYAQLEESLPGLEEKVAELEDAINHIGSHYDKLAGLTAELETANEAYEEAMLRWMELAEIAEG